MKNYNIIALGLVFLLLLIILFSVLITDTFALLARNTQPSRPVKMTNLNMDCNSYKLRYVMNSTVKCEKRKIESMRRQLSIKLNKNFKMD